MMSYSLGPDEGHTLWMFDALDTSKASAEDTGGQFALVEFRDWQGSEPLLHVHGQEDRGFYVLEDSYTFLVGDEAVPTPIDTWIFAPRNIRTHGDATPPWDECSI